jgi:integrase
LARTPHPSRWARRTQAIRCPPKRGHSSALGAAAINKTLTRLAQILDVALEYHPGLLAGNPARGGRRRLGPTAPNRSFLEAEQVAALLDAAGELDAESRRGEEHLARRATLATLVLAGLRVGELIELHWQDVDMAAGRLFVRDA